MAYGVWGVAGRGRGGARGLQKKRKRKQGTKKQFTQKTTDRLSFFFFFLRTFFFFVPTDFFFLWTCHRMWAPATGCGVFLYELVPSDDPFMWCLCDTFFFIFLRTFFIFFQRTFFLSEEEIKFVTSTTTAAVQSKSNSHVTIYYQPVEFTFCVFAVLFLIFEEEMLP